MGHVTRPHAWPVHLPPPGEPGWRHRATDFLLDLSPPDYRGHPVIAVQPAVLGWLAVRHTDAAAEAAVVALAQARAQLAGVVPPETLERLIPVLESEAARLRLASGQCRVVAEALVRAARADLAARSADARAGRRSG